jgi:GST-like protein|tara:strand:- start:143 stop:760 length:618 start_codon:yes stop_codon:yes gene_type:complete
MMKLYGFDTINTFKVLVFLLETKVEFKYLPINIRAGEQHGPEFLAINPVGKIPVLFDGEQYWTESNAILFNLAQKTGWGLLDDPNMHDRLLAWLFYQASTQGPHFGQVEHWLRFANAPNPDALARHRGAANQTIKYLDDQLSDKKYICGDAYSIADIALFPWLHIYEHLGLSLEKAEHLTRWLDLIRNRPATIEARAFFGYQSIF